MSEESPSYSTNVTMSMGGAAPQPGAADFAAGDAVRDISTAEFMSEVIEGSKSAPVLVDFWAPWCGPCKQLGPVIEKVVAEKAGQMRLVKMDIDKHPEVAGQMGIQSIPAVVAFVDGRPADAFMGAKSESEVRAFVEKIARDAGSGPQAEIDEALAQAETILADGDPAQASQIYAAILQHDGENIAALAGLGQCYLAMDDRDRARAMVDQAPDEARDKAPLSALIAALDLADQADDLGDLAGLQQAVEADPDDHQARYDLAVGLNAKGEREQAASELLTIIRKDREWSEDGARAKLLELFEAWGPTDPATLKGRRGLSSILFS